LGFHCNIREGGGREGGFLILSLEGGREGRGETAEKKMEEENYFQISSLCGGRGKDMYLFVSYYSKGGGGHMRGEE